MELIQKTDFIGQSQSHRAAVLKAKSTEQEVNALSFELPIKVEILRLASTEEPLQAKVQLSAH